MLLVASEHLLRTEPVSLTCLLLFIYSFCRSEFSILLLRNEGHGSVLLDDIRLVCYRLYNPPPAHITSPTLRTAFHLA